MEKKSWVCTLITQLSLFFALFVALNIGRPQEPIYRKSSGRTPLDLHFISVRGGFRPLKEQTRLLKQIAKVVKTYDVKFVIDVTELGEEDPLMQNATLYSQSLTVPWYATRALESQGANYFLKHVKIPQAKTLDLIVLDTGSLQDPSSDRGTDQLHWLMNILEETDSDWRIIVGFHPMEACVKNTMQVETDQDFTSLRNVCLKYGVNAYLSGQACPSHVLKGKKAEIGNAGVLERGPYFTTSNQRVVFHKDIVDWFLLHRVSSLEIVTYFISLTGEVVHKVGIQQQGKEFM